MKTLPISEELLRKICYLFATMEPSRDSLVDDCLESKVYDELKESFPAFMDDDRLTSKVSDELKEFFS